MTDVSERATARQAVGQFEERSPSDNE
jgi:hypothetical protein